MPRLTLLAAAVPNHWYQCNVTPVSPTRAVICRGHHVVGYRNGQSTVMVDRDGVRVLDVSGAQPVLLSLAPAVRNRSACRQP